MKKNDEVVAIVTYLSSFFRTTLSKGKDFITIQEEELHVESYMNIQKFRYQDVMDFEIHIDKELYPYTHLHYGQEGWGKHYLSGN